MVSLFRALVFVVSLAATCQVLRWTVPDTPIPTMTQKLEEFLLPDANYDAVFLGSSQVDGQVDPERFDATLAKHDVALRSYNFGAQRMYAFEAQYLLREILRHRPEHLRWVFLELSLFTNPVQRNEGSQRFIYWHDLTSTVSACRYVLSSRLSWSRQYSQLTGHVGAWTRQLTGPGRGANALQRLAGFQPDAGELRTPMRHGFLALDHEPGFRRSEHLDDRERWLDEFRKQVADPMWNHRDRLLRPAPRKTLDALIALVEDAGLNLVLFVAPRLSPNTRFHDGSDVYGTHPIIVLNDPERFPQLYEPEVRFDPRHVNAEGANLLSEILAQEFTKRIVGGSD